MELNHSFTVPASKADTWQTFEDIESVAGCFPGATVTSVDGDDFKGTCKVKLGPIALVYTGTGTFRERDEAAGRFVVEAKGKDKRGNGTAGATVTATFSEEAGTSTRVDVRTDLSITGKPAQFGRGVIEDISDKLLQKFVTCLQDKVGTSASSEAAAEPAGSPGSSLGQPLQDQPAAAGAVTGSAPQAGTSDQAEASDLATPVATSAPPPPPAAGTSTPPQVSAPGVSTPSEAPAGVSTPSQAPAGVSTPSEAPADALDLGATVVPVLARAYGPAALVALAALVLGYLLGRRRRG